MVMLVQKWYSSVWRWSCLKWNSSKWCWVVVGCKLLGFYSSTSTANAFVAGLAIIACRLVSAFRDKLERQTPGNAYLERWFLPQFYLERWLMSQFFVSRERWFQRLGTWNNLYTILRYGRKMVRQFRWEKIPKNLHLLKHFSGKRLWRSLERPISQQKTILVLRLLQR